MRNIFIPTLLAIAALALILRLTVSYQLADTPEVRTPNPQTDMATYLRLAADIRQGNFPDHYDYQPFYYTAVLPPLVTQSGSPWPLIILQAILGAAAVYLTGLTASLAFGRACAIPAALLLALSRFHIFYTPFALYEVLQSFWMALLLFLAVQAFRHNRWKHWLCAAVVLALAILTRGNAILYLPLLAILAVIRNRRTLPKAAGIIVATAAIAYLPQLPFALKNLSYAGRWTGPSTAGPKVLALGNSPEAPAAGLAYPLTYAKWVAQSDANTTSMASNILDWALKCPLPFMELKFRTLLSFWDSDEVPNNVNIQVHGLPFSPVLSCPLLVSFGLISTLALAGLLLNLKRARGTMRLLLAFVLIFCAATVAFYMLARFRIAILPPLCVLAAGAFLPIQRLIQQRKAMTSDERRKKILVFSLALVASGYLAYAALPHYQYLYEADVHRIIQPEGTALLFDDTALFHDHGPLPLGTGLRTQLDASGATIQKTFFIPESMRKKVAGKPFAARLMILDWPSSTSNFNPSLVAVSHGTQTAIPGPPVRRYAFSLFIETRFKTLELNSDGTATVTFAFPESAQPYPAIVLDTLRDYRRTQFSTPDTPNLELLPAEPYAELQVDLAHP